MTVSEPAPVLVRTPESEFMLAIASPWGPVSITPPPAPMLTLFDSSMSLAALLWRVAPAEIVTPPVPSLPSASRTTVPPVIVVPPE